MKQTLHSSPFVANDFALRGIAAVAQAIFATQAGAKFVFKLDERQNCISFQSIESAHEFDATVSSFCSAVGPLLAEPIELWVTRGPDNPVCYFYAGPDPQTIETVKLARHASRAKTTLYDVRDYPAMASTMASLEKHILRDRHIHAIIRTVDGAKGSFTNTHPAVLWDTEPLRETESVVFTVTVGGGQIESVHTIDGHQWRDLDMSSKYREFYDMLLEGASAEEALQALDEPTSTLIAVYVLALNSSGVPEFLVTDINLKEVDIEEGEHYATAQQRAAAAGYSPLSAFDANDTAAQAIDRSKCFELPGEQQTDAPAHIPGPTPN